MEYYVASDGSNRWSGRLPEPNLAKTDGPFRTITAARNAIRGLKAAHMGLPEPVTVNIREGTHFVGDTLTFTPRDSGTRNCPITYRAFPGEKPRISGGMRITDWQQQANGVWIAHLPEVQQGRLYFQQLFADGRRVTRARLPHDGWYRMDGMTSVNGTHCFRYGEGHIRKFQNLEDVQVDLLKAWNDCKLLIQTIDEEQRGVIFTGYEAPIPVEGDPHEDRPWSRYFLDNVFEGMDASDRWYLDRKTGLLHFRPESGDPPGMEIIASTERCLLRCKGNRRRHVEYIRFEGLSFEHADWRLPDGGYLAECQADLIDPVAIEFIDAWNCALTGGAVTHVGGYAVSLSGGCRGIEISGNEICDAGAGGIRIGEWVSDDDAPRVAVMPAIPSVAEADENREHTISLNHIHDCGVLFFGSVGIWLAHSSDNIVSHNRIHDMPYTGISVGFTWSTVDTRCKRNIIEHNEIYRIMQLMSDGAGVYCLGRSAGTVIRNNVIYGCRPPFTNNARGIYLDESATGITVRNNIVYDTGDGSMLLHVCWDNLVENNIFLEGFTSQLYFCFERGEAGQNNTIRRNIIAFSGEDTPLYQSYVSPRKTDYFPNGNLIHSAKAPVRVKVNLGEDLKWLDPPIWRTLDEVGLDQDSVFADPGFVDMASGDLRLKADSPAFEIGFAVFEADLSGLQTYIAEKKQAEAACKGDSSQ